MMQPPRFVRICPALPSPSWPKAPMSPKRSPPHASLTCPLPATNGNPKIFARLLGYSPQADIGSTSPCLPKAALFAFHACGLRESQPNTYKIAFYAPANKKGNGENYCSPSSWDKPMQHHRQGPSPGPCSTNPTEPSELNPTRTPETSRRPPSRPHPAADPNPACDASPSLDSH